MRAIVPVQTGTSGGSSTLAVSPRAIGKVSASSTLSHQKPDSDRGHENQARPLHGECVFRDDTRPFDPFWDGPRLVPAFVAQLLGQMIPERRESAMAET